MSVFGPVGNDIDWTTGNVVTSATSLPPTDCINDPRHSLAMGVIALCVYFPPLAVPVGALAAGAAIAATRKHLAG